MDTFPDKPAKKRLVYMDHAATTYVDPDVKKAMDPYFSEFFGNPSSLYSLGRTAASAVKSAREAVARFLGTHADSIIFTSGGTESDNLAICATACTNQDSGKHIITTKIEHHAVLDTCKFLEQEGFEVTYLDVNEQGQIDPKEFKKALRSDTILVSIMYANNEIGTVEPIADIGREILKWRKKNQTAYPYFHSDACQASGALELDVEKLHVDLLSLNASKMYGPKGIGVLYKRKGVKIHPLMHGGGQEMGFRSGTENVPGITGLAKALELATENREEENERLRELRNYFWDEVQKEIPKVHLNGPELGDKKGRLPNNLNVTVDDIEGEALLLYLNEYGIFCSNGNACTSDSVDPSHVLLACGLSRQRASESLRFTLGKRSTKKDVDYVMKYLPILVAKLRTVSPNE